MKKYMTEQENAAKPPERRGEPSPDEARQRELEQNSGETLSDETFAEEERVEWDGSEAELVADEDAADYEEQNTGIQLKYTLRPGEVYAALMKMQYTQQRVVMTVAASVLGLISAVLSFVNFYSLHANQNLLLGAVCLVLVFLILWMPAARNRAIAKSLADGKEILMTVYPDHVEMGRGENEWEFPLDGSCGRTVLRDLILLYIDEENTVILPIRSIEPAVLPEVQAMLYAGTRPEK
ncbi:MAG: YcxB family protein [Clostridiales bacterium]|nr:YcxB family protein [Clostridiales bacterium]